jgi:hypothetical protein
MLSDNNTEEKFCALNQANKSADDRGPRSGREADLEAAEGACSGITPLITSQNTDKSFIDQDAVVAVDWLETAGTIQWDLTQYETYFQTNSLQAKAIKDNQPVPIMCGGKTCLIHPNGMGSKKQSRLTHRITWGSVTLGLAFRNQATRQLSNYSLTIPGDACVILGYENCRTWALQTIAELTGKITDEWIRRIDVCGDFPNIDIQDELIPAFKESRFITTANDTSLYTHKRKESGFVVGNRQRVRMVVYDKYLECQKQSPDYRHAMIHGRWKGKVPQAATRVEVSIYRGWLSQWKEDCTTKMLTQIGSLLSRIFQKEGKCFFRLTNEIPDRENNNQSRCTTLPLWQSIQDKLLSYLNESHLHLTRLDRGSMSDRWAYQQVKGILCNYAARQGAMVTGIDDAKAILEVLHLTHESTDKHWQKCWEQKALKLGLIEEPVQFP